MVREVLNIHPETSMKDHFYCAKNTVLGSIHLLMVPYIKVNGSTTKEKERGGWYIRMEMHFKDFLRAKVKKAVQSGGNGTSRDS